MKNYYLIITNFYRIDGFESPFSLFFRRVSEGTGREKEFDEFTEKTSAVLPPSQNLGV
jgi:hypothetical protein